MFEHSIKVPRLYKTAAKIAERVKLHGESVKQVYDDKLKHRNIKALYALIVSTVQNDSNLEFLLKKSDLLRKETRLDPWLAKVLITELLWGKKRLPGNSKPVETIISYQTTFNSHLNEIEQPRNMRETVDKPRYVRINILKISVNEAIDAFRDEGWVLVKFFDKNDYPAFLSKISSLEESEFMVDLHVPYLLIFPPKTEFYNHAAYRNGLIALQDKASCLPAHILNPAADSKVLDMCAAPGMKTTQLASIMNGSGVIYAIERDSKRAKVLRSMIQGAGAEECVQIVERDVLDVCKRKGGLMLAAENDRKFQELDGKVESSEVDEDSVYRGVDYILVDPSCSGSGMVEGPEKLGNFQTDQNRLKKLAGFQIMILKHALRSFPSAKRVVYSTCSLNVEENEEVVREVLQSAQHFKLVDVKILCEPWKNFGSESYGDIGSFCLYTRPEVDLTNGFFVAVFDRLETGEENRFLLQREYVENKFKDGSKLRTKKITEDNPEAASSGEYNKMNQKSNKQKKINQGFDEEVTKNPLKSSNDTQSSETNVFKIDAYNSEPVSKMKRRNKERVQEVEDVFENTLKHLIEEERQSVVCQIDSLQNNVIKQTKKKMKNKEKREHCFIEYEVKYNDESNDISKDIIEKPKKTIKKKRSKTDDVKNEMNANIQVHVEYVQSVILEDGEESDKKKKYRKRNTNMKVHDGTKVEVEKSIFVEESYSEINSKKDKAKKRRLEENVHM